MKKFFKTVLLIFAISIVFVGCNTRTENASLVNRWMSQNVAALGLIFEDPENPPSFFIQLDVVDVLSHLMTNVMNRFIFDFRDGETMILTTIDGFSSYETTYTIDDIFLTIARGNQILGGIYHISGNTLNWSVSLQFLLDFFKEFDLETDFFRELDLGDLLGDLGFEEENIRLKDATIRMELRKL
ncbi:MAG: hypothetical protein FWC94_04935 [Bacteroidales bacterium]|nr:hypothetical protein [Bacteroidales bacterium]